MKIQSVIFLLAAATLAGCSTAANNGANANLRGTNTNTGYVTNANTNVKPTIPANSTNITPGNLTAGNNTNTKSNSNANANLNRTPHNGN